MGARAFCQTQIGHCGIGDHRGDDRAVADVEANSAVDGTLPVLEAFHDTAEHFELNSREYSNHLKNAKRSGQAKHQMFE